MRPIGSPWDMLVIANSGNHNLVKVVEVTTTRFSHYSVWSSVDSYRQYEIIKDSMKQIEWI